MIEKTKHLEEIKTVLKNNNVDYDDWDTTGDTTIYCEIIAGISLKLLNKIQNELSNIEIGYRNYYKFWNKMLEELKNKKITCTKPDNNTILYSDSSFLTQPYQKEYTRTIYLDSNSKFNSKLKELLSLCKNIIVKENENI